MLTLLYNADKAVWSTEPLDNRVSAYIRKTLKSRCRRPKELQL